MISYFNLNQNSTQNERELFCNILLLKIETNLLPQNESFCVCISNLKLQSFWFTYTITDLLFVLHAL